MIAHMPVVLMRSVCDAVSRVDYLSDAINQTSLSKFRNEFDVAFTTVFYPWYAIRNSKSTFVQVKPEEFRYLGFHDNPKPSMKALIEIIIEYPPRWLCFNNIATNENLENNGLILLQSTIERFILKLDNLDDRDSILMDDDDISIDLDDFAEQDDMISVDGEENFVNILTQACDRGTFPLHLFVDCENVSNYHIKPLNHDRLGFDAFDFNFIHQMTKSNFKYRNSGVSRGGSYDRLKTALFLKIPNTFKIGFEDFDMPPSFFEDAVSQYHTNLANLITIKRMKTTLKVLVFKLLSEMVASRRTKKHHQIVKKAQLKNYLQRLDNLKKKEKTSKSDIDDDFDSFYSNDSDDDASNSDDDASIMDDDLEELVMEKELSVKQLGIIRNSIVGWVESLLIPNGKMLPLRIVQIAFPLLGIDICMKIKFLVDILRLYYPRKETIKSGKFGEESLNLSQCIPFLQLSNWIFHQLGYFKQIKAFIPQISAGVLHSIALTPTSIYSLFFQDHNGSGSETRLAKYMIPGITSVPKAVANPEVMMYFLFKSSVIENAIKKINCVSTENVPMVAQSAHRYNIQFNLGSFSKMSIIVS
jgi:hypothetical protein